MQPAPEPSSRFLILSACLLGIASFGVILLFHNIADGDLWAKLALGAAVWKDGKLPSHDVFAFTPTLPVYVDHEWGSGLVFFSFLKWFGPGSLLLLKVALAFLTIGTALLLGRRFGADWSALLMFAIPAAICVLPGFVTVIRSHTFTYACFAVTLLLLELIREGRRWPGFALVALMTLWVNLHGGFVAGLGTIGIYTLASLFERKAAGVMLPTFVACVAATAFNPYGPKYWSYVLPAILHKRPDIIEWQPMPLWANDAFIGFRILLILTVCFLVIRRQEAKTSRPGLCMLVITVVLALRSRRHAPFFGIAALAIAAPCVSSVIRAAFEKCNAPPLAKIHLARAVLATFVALALFVSIKFLPGASLQVLAPISQFPVREADILSRAGLSGNLAVPFEWGSYASWRLYPKIKVSMDGRYEAAYPESTYEMNRDFFAKRGPGWDRMLKLHNLDFVMLDLRLSNLKPLDLEPKGYTTVWRQEGVSALVVANKYAAQLKSVVAELPPTTIQALDASIPAQWPRFDDAK